MLECQDVRNFILLMSVSFSLSGGFLLGLAQLPRRPGTSPAGLPAVCSPPAQGSIQSSQDLLGVVAVGLSAQTVELSLGGSLGFLSFSCLSCPVILVV